MLLWFESQTSIHQVLISVLFRNAGTMQRRGSFCPSPTDVNTTSVSAESTSFLVSNQVGVGGQIFPCCIF